MANLVKLSVPVCQEKDYVLDLCKDGMFLFIQVKGGRGAREGWSYFKSYTELTAVGSFTCRRLLLLAGLVPKVFLKCSLSICAVFSGVLVSLLWHEPVLPLRVIVKVSGCCLWVQQLILKFRGAPEIFSKVKNLFALPDRRKSLGNVRGTVWELKMCRKQLRLTTICSK